MNLMRLFLISVLLLGIGGGIYFAKNSFLRAWFGSGLFLHEFLAVANPNILGNSEPAKSIDNSGNAHGITPKKENLVSRKLSAGVAAHTVAQAVVSQSSIIPASVTSAENASTNQALTKQQTGSAQPLLCSPSSQKTLSRSMLINEVAWAGVSSDKTTEEWIELKNNSGANILLDGWQMQNKNQGIKIFFSASDMIPAGGLYLLERGSNNFLQGVKADKFFTSAIKNSDEALRLFDRNCNAVDEVVADVGADKNWSAGTVSSEYRTAERSVDLSWHSYSGSGANGIFGTPAAENSPAPISVNAASSVSQSQTQSPPLSLPSPPTYYTLQFSKSGTGAGSVTSNPSGISCGSFCVEDSEDFVSGTAVLLNAVAADGSEFAGWSGDCSGIGACFVSLTSVKSVRAVFNQIAISAPPPPPSQTVSSSARSNVNHILISQVQITGGAGQTTNDFIELYNPTAGQFNLKGYRLVKRAKTSTSDTSVKSWTSDEFIPGYGFYLWANSNYTTIAITPDATTTASIADDNGIAIRLGPNDTGTIIDSVAWGGAQNIFVEGAPYATNPVANQSIARKSWQNACVASSFDTSIGNGCDTNNNASDFELASSSHPRNSRSQ